MKKQSKKVTNRDKKRERKAAKAKAKKRAMKASAHQAYLESPEYAKKQARKREMASLALLGSAMMSEPLGGSPG